MEEIKPEVVAGNFLSRCSNKLPEEIIKKAETELGETPEMRKNAVKELRRLIHAEADFRPKLEDAFLLRFLRAKKFNTQKAFNMLKNFYTFKARYSKILTDFKPSELKHVFDQNAFGPLPYRDSEGHLLGMVKIGIFNFDKASMDEMLAASLVSAEACIENEVTQICGFVIMLDCKGITLKTVRQVATPALMYRIVRLLQDCFPARFKALHCINEPFFANVVYKVLRTFLPEKLKQRIHFHGTNLQSLHEIIPGCILTEEFGGELGPFDCSEHMQTLLNREEMYERNAKYGYHGKQAQFIRKRSSLSSGLYV